MGKLIVPIVFITFFAVVSFYVIIIHPALAERAKKRQFIEETNRRNKLEEWRHARPTTLQREVVLEEVARAYAAGQLDKGEHDDLVEQALKCRTNAELAVIPQGLQVVERPE